MKLCFDAPGQVRATVLLEDDVVAFGVDVFGVEEEPVHVEQTGSNLGEPVPLHHQYGPMSGSSVVEYCTHSMVFAIIFA